MGNGEKIDANDELFRTGSPEMILKQISTRNSGFRVKHLRRSNLTLSYQV